MMIGHGLGGLHIKADERCTNDLGVLVVASELVRGIGPTL